MLLMSCVSVVAEHMSAPLSDIDIETSGKSHSQLMTS